MIVIINANLLSELSKQICVMFATLCDTIYHLKNLYLFNLSHPDSQFTPPFCLG